MVHEPSRPAATPAETLLARLPDDAALPAGVLAFGGAGVSPDGRVVALAIRGGAQASVVVARRGAGAATAEVVIGRLIPSTAPLLVRRDDEEAIVIEDLANEQRYEVPWAGIAEGPSVPWFRDTVWAVTPPGRPPLLIRAFTTGDLSATRIRAYRPGAATLAWEVALRVGTTPAVVADALVSDDGRVVMVQYTDGKQGARLVAYDIDTGAERWAQATGVTYSYFGALIAAPDGRVATLLSDAERCEVCERLEIRRVADGSLERAVSLEGPSVLARLGPRNVETFLGITGDELWFRFANGPQAADGMVAEHYSYDAFDLRTGTHRTASDAWASTFAAGTAAAVASQDGLIVVAPGPGRTLSLAVFRQAP